MTHEEKVWLWERYPDIWALFVEFNDIAHEDDESWKKVVDRAQEISTKYNRPVVDELLQETVYELDKISRRKK